jgi:predicted DNA-binding transcriptional regulator YafY
MDCYSSLQKGLRLQVTYAKDTRGGSKEFDFSPLGMLLDGEVMYLVGMAREHENVISLALHRMQQSMVLSTKARRLSGFRLEDYARESLFDLNRSGAVKLHLKVRGRLARYLVENKLGPDQTMTDLEDGWSEVRVTANDASPLRWWLLSWGDKVEVLGPAPLRREFGKIFKELASNYQI